VFTPHGHCQFPLDVEPFPHSETTLAVYLASLMFKGISPSESNPFKVEDFKYDHVNFYVMAPRSENKDNVGNYWTSLPDWPTYASTKYYLHEGGKLLLNPPTQGLSYDEYVYNPWFPVPTWGGNNLFWSCGPRKQNLVDDRSDVITFRSDILQDNLAITGRIKAVLHVSSDKEDTDFTVKLMDEYPSPDGSAYLVVDSIFRMKFRNGTKLVPTKIDPWTVYEISVDLTSTSWIFPKGHRIRISVSSSNFPKYQSHINQFKPIKDWGILDGYNAKNRLYHQKDHMSYLEIPVVKISDIPKNPDIGLRL